MINLLQVENFFNTDDTIKLFNVVNNLQFVDKEYGKEIENFNFVIPGLEPIFSKLLGETIIINEELSGVFRKPSNIIHFESFSSYSDWIFIIALEPTIFNLYYHVNTKTKSALTEYKFNYKNFIEWDYYTNILLEPNQGIIFKPWLFHSLQNGLIQVYRLEGEKCH